MPKESRSRWETLGDRLRWAIEKQPPEGRSRGVGLLMRKLGEVPGATYASIGTYLRNDVRPPLEFIEKAAVALKVDPRWLAFGGPDPTPVETRAEPPDPPWLALREAIPWLEDADPTVTAAFLSLLNRAHRGAQVLGLDAFDLGGDDGFFDLVAFCLEEPIEHWARIAGTEEGAPLRLDIDRGSDYALAMLHALTLSMEVAFEAIANRAQEKETDDG